MAGIDLNAAVEVEADAWIDLNGPPEEEIDIEEEADAWNNAVEEEQAILMAQEEEHAALNGEVDVFDLNVELPMDDANELNADEQLHNANVNFQQLHNADELNADEQQGGSEYLCFMLFNLCCS
ncbi:unnamed protein product [Urochloa humidicola]